MDIHSATILMVISTFTLTVSLVWVLVGNMLKLSMHASLHWALANTMMGSGLFFWVYEKLTQSLLHQFMSETLLLAGFCVLRRGLLVFTKQKKRDTEQILIILSSIIVFLMLQDPITNHVRKSFFLILCTWVLVRSSIETFGQMVQEFPLGIVLLPVLLLSAIGCGFAVNSMLLVSGLNPVTNDFLTHTAYNGVILLGVQIASFYFNVTLAFIVVSRLVLKLKYLSTRDHLTGLFNRRQIQIDLQKLIDGLSKNKKPFSLIMMDLDKFKNINDTLGHAAGDMVLKRVSAVFERLAGDKGRTGRLGGEEFCIVMPNAGVSEARAMAEEIRIGVATQSMQGDKGEFFVTSSFGVATCVSAKEGWSNLMKRADIALYIAKTSGRNRVQLADTQWIPQSLEKPQRPAGIRLRDMGKE